MEKYILKAINGDKDAFTFLFLSLQTKLYNIAFCRLKNESDALDAIQETIIITYNNLKDLKKFESFDSWVISILINECNKIYNKKNKVEYVDILNYQNEFYIDGSENDNLFFEDLICSLTEKEKIIMILYYKNDYSIREISKTLEIKNNTVKSIIKRAKEKIKLKLKE